jgi:hypothetical protein
MSADANSHRSPSRPAALPVLSTLLVLACGAPALAEDMRTRSIRVVPELTWSASPGPIAVVTANESDHEKGPAFTADLAQWLTESFDRLDYEVRDDAETRFIATLEILDPGSAALRFGVGFGAGKSHVEGRVLVERAGEVVGRYRFSARPKGAGTNFPAKEVGPPLVLQITQGEADEALHEYKPKADKSKD